MNGRDDAASFRQRIISSNRDAFELFKATAGVIEEAIPKARDIGQPFARALDLLFLQAYKSFAALYLLGVAGHGEDAATILRRLLEISWQVGFLVVDPGERNNRGEKYLAYYWARVPELLKQSLPIDAKLRLEDLFEQHKHLLSTKWATPKIGGAEAFENLRRGWGPSQPTTRTTASFANGSRDDSGHSDRH